MNLNTFDHVALWTDERDALATLLTECCEMHEIERTDRFTLVGGDARLGKLTLFDATGPREPGVLERVVLRVADPDEVRRKLGAAGIATDARNGVVTAETPSGLTLGLVRNEETAVTDLDHVVLRVPSPESTVSRLRSSGSNEPAIDSASRARSSSCARVTSRRASRRS